MKPKDFRVKKKRINPLKVLAKANPEAPKGEISNREKTIFDPKAFIDIFAARNCFSFAYNQREKILAKP